MGIVLQEEAEVSNCCEIGKQSQLLPDPFKFSQVPSRVGVWQKLLSNSL